MEKIFNFSSFSALYETGEGATAAAGATAGATGATAAASTAEGKSYEEEIWYPYLEPIISGIITEVYAPIVQLAPQGSYDINPDFASIKSAKTLDEKSKAFEKILSNASAALDPKDIGYDELKKVSEEYTNVGKKYLSALPVLKEKSGTNGDEISDAINSLMELIQKKIGENKPK